MTVHSILQSLPRYYFKGLKQKEENVYQTDSIIQIHHGTEVRFASFLSSEFTTMTVINPSDWKLANRTSVHGLKSNKSCLHFKYSDGIVLINRKSFQTWSCHLMNLSLGFICGSSTQLCWSQRACNQKHKDDNNNWNLLQHQQITADTSLWVSKTIS